MTHARKITRQFGTAAHDNLFEAADLIGGICAGGYIYLDDGSTLRICVQWLRVVRPGTNVILTVGGTTWLMIAPYTVDK